MGIGAAILLMILAGIMLLVFWPIGLIAALFAVVMPFVGLFAKGANCPNCSKELVLTSGKIRCSDCKHRLAVRNGMLFDVT